MSHRPIYADLDEMQPWRSGDYIRALTCLTYRDGSILYSYIWFGSSSGYSEKYRFIRCLRQLSPRKNSGLTCFNGHTSFNVLLLIFPFRLWAFKIGPDTYKRTHSQVEKYFLQLPLFPNPRISRRRITSLVRCAHTHTPPSFVWRQTLQLDFIGVGDPSVPDEFASVPFQKIMNSVSSPPNNIRSVLYQQD